MVNDQEPRYRLVDADGSIVGSLFAEDDGTLKLQEGTSGNDNELALDADGGVQLNRITVTGTLETERASIGWPSGETAVKISDQSITQSGSDFTVDWDSTENDPDNNWDLTNNEYVVPEDGSYLVIYQAKLSNPKTGRVNVDLQVNGSISFGDKNDFDSQPFLFFSPSCVDVLPSLSSGDSIKPAVFVDDAGSMEILGQSTATYCSISKMS